MTLYGFFHSGCIYESEEALMSLHQTKAGAYRAMVERQYTMWEACRNVDLPRGLSREVRQSNRDYGQFRPMESYSVRPVEVLP